MKITEIRQRTVSLTAPGRRAIRNADIGYDSMTASAVVVLTDQERNGKPLAGLGFDSIGRYGHGALLAERFAPRLLAAEPDDYADDGGSVDPMRAWAVAMTNEKPGGHGERAGAVGLLDSALWDLAAKTAGVPLWSLLADRFGDGTASDRVAVYASGGHYREGGEEALVDEVRRWADRGHTRFKVKIGGASRDEDQRRLGAVRAVTGPNSLAIDGNGTFDRATARFYFDVAEELDLAWVEEPAPPLDYTAHVQLARDTSVPIGTGENIFSLDDARNLLRHAGLRPDRDLLQMDVALSYGLPEYLRIIQFAEAEGWARRSFAPHAGHFFAFHVVAGLGLGLHECAPDDAEIYGGLPLDTVLEGGNASLPSDPGVGIERKSSLYAVFEDLLP